MTKEEALKLALVALERFGRGEGGGLPLTVLVHNLREVLEQPEQEPVGWFGYDQGTRIWFETNKGEDNSVPLYTAPPQRTWVGLTDEELPPLVGDNGKYMELQQVRRFYKYIEAKLKEKNT